jgi:tryptophan-rich sensory protein
MKGRNIGHLLFWVLLCQLTGLIGSVFTRSGLEPWYASLEKPAYNPPDWLFGPVWAVLYTLMGIAVFLVSRKYGERPRAAAAVRLFILHLFFNASFSFSFFYLESTLMGLINILIVLAFIVVLLFRFFRISKTAGWLLVPYLLWVVYATAANAGLWILN